MNINFSMSLQLFAVSLVPVALTLIFCLLDKYTAFKNIPNYLRQIIIGVAFGAAAIFGTENGVDIGGAQANARDAAPILAGLVFGGPAGIIAGLLGGIERYISVLWGIGKYSQLACSVSTALAGFYAAFLREKLFEKKAPTWGIGFATGAIMEVIHMTILFITHITDANQAFEVIKICSVPMIIVNGLSVLLGCIVVSFFAHRENKGVKVLKTINQKLQRSLLTVVLISGVAAIVFSFLLQTSTADTNAINIIDTNIKDIKNDILETSNKELVSTMRDIKGQILEDESTSLVYFISRYKVNEINICDKDGIIIKSNYPDYVGFDMKSSPETAEYMSMLENHFETLVQEPRQNALSDQVDIRKYAGILFNDGFMQVGLDNNKFEKLITETIEIFTKNRHIGNEGGIFIANRDQIIVNQDKNNGKTLEEIGIDLNKKATYNDIYKAEILGIPSLYSFVQADSFYIIGFMPESEVYSTREATTYVNSFMQVLIFAALFVLMFFFIRRYIIKDISRINADMDKITEGDLDVRLEPSKTNEFNSLSNGINHAVSTIKHYNDAEKEKIEKDLQLAKNIQHSALPSIFPKTDEYNIFATMRTAKEVGGDFYDFYSLGKDKLAILIADVSGKGVPAAMFMMTAKTMLKNLTESGLELGDVFTMGNNKLCEGNDAGMFVTVWMGIIDLDTGHVQFVNAGHNPPVVYRKAENAFDYLPCKAGFVMAGMEGVKYRLQEFDLNPGDKVLLYTDGVTEATDTHDELFGEDRLKNYLNSAIDVDVENTIGGVLNSIDEFVGEREQFDDITMLMVQFNGRN